MLYPKHKYRAWIAAVAADEAKNSRIEMWIQCTAIWKRWPIQEYPFNICVCVHSEDMIDSPKPSVSWRSWWDNAATVYFHMCGIVLFSPFGVYLHERTTIDRIYIAAVLSYQLPLHRFMPLFHWIRYAIERRTRELQWLRQNAEARINRSYAHTIWHTAALTWRGGTATPHLFAMSHVFMTHTRARLFVCIGSRNIPCHGLALGVD